MSTKFIGWFREDCIIKKVLQILDEKETKIKVKYLITYNRRVLINKKWIPKEMFKKKEY